MDRIIDLLFIKNDAKLLRFQSWICCSPNYFNFSIISGEATLSASKGPPGAAWIIKNVKMTTTNKTGR